VAEDTQQDNPHEVAFNLVEDGWAAFYRYRFYYRGITGFVRPLLDVASKYEDSISDRYFGKVDGGTPRYVSIGGETYGQMGNAVLQLINHEFPE
jgi:hypothetical protein